MGLRLKAVFFSDAFFLRKFTYTIYAQYASMNEFICSERFVRIRRSKKRNIGNQP